jgi:uncharacterized protein (DUF1800 family)
MNFNEPNSMMKSVLSFSIVFFSGFFIHAQTYTDYLGAGHNAGITVTASSEMQRNAWNEKAAAANTVNGKGLDSRLLETSRFLAQATFGCPLGTIQTVAAGSYEQWIDDQFTKPYTSLAQSTAGIYEQAKAMYIANGGNGEDYFGPSLVHFVYAWWDHNMNNEDLLRQRVALALSEIAVISSNSALGDYGVGLGSYYDLLSQQAFGNYKDLLMGISLHPMMAGYLSHYNNPKSNDETNVHPDENYAREIMQLFTIGLYELNDDGSYKLDQQNNRIPTYDNYDIKELAKVFTGLSAAEIIENEWVEDPYFGIDFWFCNKEVPLAMYEEFHEPGEKQLLNGLILPPGQTGMKDIEDAVTGLFNHPNTGPFLCRRLIQQLVKSNPGPAYISRVVQAFNNTNGVRGDMKAVIKAILLDEEARNCEYTTEANSGKLTEPMVRYFNVCRQTDLISPSGLDWNIGYNFYTQTGQMPLASPTVFNFFLPDFSPNGPISDAGLVAPEFQIHNSVTSIGFWNEVDLMTSPEWNYPVFNNWEIDWEQNTRLDFTRLKYLARDSEVLINELDKLFTRGQLSPETRASIKAAVDPIEGSDPGTDYMHYRVKMALYLFLVSPDYAILK